MGDKQGIRDSVQAAVSELRKVLVRLDGPAPNKSEVVYLVGSGLHELSNALMMLMREPS